MAEPVTFKYRAFISYSHADTAWAKWLHRALEGFRIDKDMIGRETETGTIPKSLRPIFRDRDDFTAGHTLTDQTLAALDASAALIVICSPKAATSEYVTEEIRLFKSRHPDRPVIPLIVDGTPGDANQECFPRSLRFKLDDDSQITDESLEVLAADARERGDGKPLALAKVVAGLLGVSADDIFARAERERRKRQRRWIAGLASVAIVLAGLSVWAEINRQEAVIQREAAIEQRDRADSELKRAQISQSRFLANSARRVAEGGDATTAALLALEGLPDSATGNTRPYVEEAEKALFNALLRNRERLVISHPETIAQAKFTSDGEQVVALTASGKLLVWDAKSGAEVSASSLPPVSTPGVARFSKDLSRIAVSSGPVIEVRRADDDQGAVTLRGAQADVTKLTLSPDGRRLFSAYGDGTAALWDTESGAVVGVLSATAAAFSPDGTKICVLSARSPSLRVLDGRNGTILHEFDADDVTHCSFSRDNGVLLTSSSDKSVRLLSLTGDDDLPTITGFQEGVEYAALSPDQRYLVAYTGSGEIHVIDLHEKRRLVLNAPDRENFHCSNVKLSFTEDGSRLAVACLLYRVWDSATMAVISRIRIFDPYSGKAVLELSGLQDGRVPVPVPIIVSSVSFNPAGDRVLAVASDNTIRIWAVDNEESGGSLAKGGFSFQLDEAGTAAKTVAADDISQIRKHFATTDELVAFAKEILPRCITPAQRAAYFLSDAPPHWCITGTVSPTRETDAQQPKWPYRSDDWKDWHARVLKGEDVPLPEKGS